MTRRLSTVAFALLMCAVSAQDALACPSCFGAADGPTAQASVLGIAALLVVTAGVLGCVALFMRNLYRRASDPANQVEPVAPVRGGAA